MTLSVCDEMQFSAASLYKPAVRLWLDCLLPSRYQRVLLDSIHGEFDAYLLVVDEKGYPESKCVARIVICLESACFYWRFFQTTSSGTLNQSRHFDLLTLDIDCNTMTRFGNSDSDCMSPEAVTTSALTLCPLCEPFTLSIGWLLQFVSLVTVYLLSLES